MNILLIYPQFPETFWSFTYALRFIGKKAAFPPLGLLTVAALLQKLKTPEINQPLNMQRFLSFFRAAFRLGVLGKERFQYWQLLLWTLSCRPRMIPMAITLSIYGYHYRRICELHIF